MSFQKRRVQKKPTHLHKKRSYKKTSFLKRTKVTQWKKLTKLLSWLIMWFLFSLIVWTVFIYFKYIKDLPAISELENLEIAEASTIYDREWNELYKIFEEKRTYKKYEDINQNIIHALVAWEDKRFFENPGIDFIGLTRAVLYKLIGKSDKIEGTSTLTQQLIRNMIITNERTAERKIKEMYLAYKLTNSVSKEKILELYLNKISYGSNAFGIEQASQTFFGKSAKDIGVLEASMLASLPKWPTYYSPYNHFDRLVGYPYIYNKEDSEAITDLISPKSIEEHQSLITQLKVFIDGFKVERFSESKTLICGLKKDMLKKYISIDKDGCSVIDYSDLLTLLNGIKISSWDTILEYQTGRKDFILGRMLEEEYITFDEYKQALLSSIGFEFESYKENIKYPHFVFYVKEYLENKYGKELIERGWLQIYTSIDPKLQDKAQEIIEKGAASNEAKFGAQNAALISLDNQTGEILAMVGGRDYFDEENKGNINMTTAELQPGSSFKPFVYSLAIDQEIIGTKTPIYDVKTRFPGWYTPANFDGKFMGKMNISTALNHSRNIPAVKMFFLAGWEEKIIEWMEKLWVETIRRFRDETTKNLGYTYNYGASMALGTAMMTPLELARAYSTYANLWYRKDIIPVIKILDSNGLVIEEFKPEENQWEEAIDASTAFITNHILSDTEARPAFWNNYLSLSGRQVAAKTGTSTKQTVSGWRKIIHPRNLWTIGYTPQITTVVWSGNNDGSETNFSGNGLEASWTLWKQFMDFAHKWKPVLRWKRPAGVKEVNISKISGKLAPDTLAANFTTSSLFINVPREFDSSMQEVRVDLLCNGTVDEKTPISAIWSVNLLSFHSLKPNNIAWELPVQEWVAKWEYEEEFGKISAFVSSVNQNSCERSHLAGNTMVWANIKDWEIFVNGSNYIEIAYQSNQTIKQIDVLLDDQKIKQIDIGNKKQWVYVWDINIPKGTLGNKSLVIKAIDDEYYSQWKSYAIKVIKRDNEAPVISITNPIDSTVSLYQGDFFNLRWEVDDRSWIRSINIYINDSPIKIGITGRKFVQEIKSAGLAPWKYTIKVEAVDMDFNIGTTFVNLEILG